MTRKSQKFLNWTSFGFKMIKTVFRICSLDTTQSRKPSRHISHDRCHVTGITTGRLCRLRFHINKFSGFHYITIFHWPTSTSHIPSHTISHTSSHTHHQSCTKIFLGFFNFLLFFLVWWIFHFFLHCLKFPPLPSSATRAGEPAGTRTAAPFPPERKGIGSWRRGIGSWRSGSGKGSGRRRRRRRRHGSWS